MSRMIALLKRMNLVECRCRHHRRSQTSKLYRTKERSTLDTMTLVRTNSNSYSTGLMFLAAPFSFIPCCEDDVGIQKVLDLLECTVFLYSLLS